MLSAAHANQFVMNRYILNVLLLVCALTVGADEKAIVGHFSSGTLEEWEEKSFAGHTVYEIVDGQDGKVLRAATRGQASGLFKEVDIDLNETPWLNWSWKIRKTFQNNNEKTKSGDDYPARIYVVVSGGVFFWRTRAINYVWSSHQPVGSRWPNAFTDNAKMLAVRSGDQHAGTWVAEKRNVQEDFAKLFGDEIDKIDAVAVMVDGDNTGQSAESFFGDIYFTQE